MSAARIGTLRWPRRRVVLTALVIAVLAFAAWTASRNIHPGALEAAFSGVDWTWVVLSCVAYAVCQFTSALVWHVGLSAGGLAAVGRLHAIGAHWIARGATEFVPTPVGDAARVAALRRHPAAHEGGSLRIVGSIGAYRLVDGVVSFIVMAVLTLVVPLPAGYGGLRWLAGGVLACMALLGLAGWRIGPERGARLVPRRLRPVLGQVAGGAAMLSQRRHMAGAVGLQLLTVLGRIASLAALLHAFGMPAGAAPLVFCLMVLAGLVAISPGGLGVREAAVVPVLVATYGMAAEPALAFSLAVQATALVVSVTGAAAALAAVQLRPPRAA